MVPQAGRMFQVLADTGALSRVLPGLCWNEQPLSAELVCAAHNNLSLAARFALVCRLSDDPQSVARHVKEPGECQEYARMLPIMLAHVNADEGPARRKLIGRCKYFGTPGGFMRGRA